jgi:hypothetical protein
MSLILHRRGNCSASSEPPGTGMAAIRTSATAAATTALDFVFGPAAAKFAGRLPVARFGRPKRARLAGRSLSVARRSASMRGGEVTRKWTKSTRWRLLALVLW